MRRTWWLALAVFGAAVLFHLMGINQAGRTWDEQFKMDMGYLAWNRWLTGDFSVTGWHLGTEHPMVAKYLYGMFLPLHLVRLDRVGPVEQVKLARHEFILTQIGDEFYAVDYDWTAIRFVSAVFNSLAVAGIFLMATWFLPEGWALLAPVSLLLTPRFLAMGKQVTYESLTAVLTVGAALLFARLLREQERLRFYLWVGLVAGLLIFTRYNNVYILVLLSGWWVIHQMMRGPRLAGFNWRLILIPSTALAFGFVSWPLLWHQFPRYLIESVAENWSRPVGFTFYYLTMLLTTTPVIWLIGLGLGIVKFCQRHKEKDLVMLWWLVSVLAIFSWRGIESGGTRYIFFVYPAVGVTAAVGWHFLLGKSQSLLYYLGLILAYALWSTLAIHPYYLDYYNELVGGVAGAVRRGLEVSWWGEGQREAGRYLNQVGRSGARVALMVTPHYVMPPLRPDLKVEGYGVFGDEDYVVVSRTNLSEMKEKLEKDYRLIYEAKAGGVMLVSLWERIRD